MRLSQTENGGITVSTAIVSGKRQVVLPADLCRQLAIAPGARVEVELAPDGGGIVVRPGGPGGGRPASVLFGRFVHRGKPLPIEELQGVAAAAKLARAGRL